MSAEGKRKSTSEQRQHRRYNVSLPVRVNSTSEPEASTVGTSRDISAVGIYLTIPKGFDLHSQLEFDLELPSEITGGNQVRVRCTARIIRVSEDENSDTVGVAAAIRAYRFLRMD